ncbi:MAG: DNA primase [Chloroflexi bacterium]|nr:DNA primase [Chloroflexota bacterium]
MGVADEVRQRLDIVEVVSQYVQLQKAGRHFKARCPFHSEKTPSFIVSPERQTWHCFGACGTGGDVFSFLMKADKIEFPEALRRLADRAGVALAPPSPEETRAREDADRLYRVNEAAARYYHNLLLSSAPAEGARGYVHRRGLSPETVARFELGYSLDVWRGLQDHLLAAGFSREDTLAAGLCVARQDGGSYDLFRGRLLFPIRNDRGRVVGFGGRALDASNPKYLNTPQTPVFDKGSVLYGIDQATAAIRSADRAVIVEGYFDVLMAHQMGYGNVVASMGTALTERQVAVLRRFTRNLVLALDADAAGDEATLRAIVTVGQALGKATVPVPTSTGIRYQTTYRGDVRVASLPLGKDPDEVLLEGGEAWPSLVANGLSVIEYVFKATLEKLDLTQASGKQGAAEKLLPIIAELTDPVAEAHYLQRLARVVGVTEVTLRSALPRVRRSRQAGAGHVPALVPQRQRLEEFCLGLLLRYPGLRALGSQLAADDFQCTENREMFRLWQEGSDVARLQGDESMGAHIAEVVAQALPPATPKEIEADLAQVMRRLRERRLRALKLEEAAWESEDPEVNLEEVEARALPINTQLRQIFSQPPKGEAVGG